MSKEIIIEASPEVCPTCGKSNFVEQTKRLKGEYYEYFKKNKIFPFPLFGKFGGYNLPISLAYKKLQEEGVIAEGYDRSLFPNE
jgi:hypothetical protein